MFRYIVIIILLLSQFTYASEQAQSINKIDELGSQDREELIYKKLDPYEKFNRKIFALNLFLDKALLRPSAAIYHTILPKWGKNRVSDFTANLRQPLTILNYSLQLDKKNSLKAFKRFCINSTLGIGGLFDLASRKELNLIVAEQSFNSTAYHYKIKPGVYIMLPILGPTNLRGMVGAALDFSLDPINIMFKEKFILAEKSLDLVDVRDDNREFLEHIERTSMDPYSTIRSFYIQKYAMTPKGNKNMPNYDEY